MTKRDLLIDCCMRNFDKSPKGLLIAKQSQLQFILMIQLNSVALKQSEPLGHGHYLFHSVD